ncbi:Gx transporter family protein [Youngiibacter multivorans]|uniref:Heptaprenyl diphosphate synthase n=1 Tax=Youngiibacter multivorans TaxID=937251 RepID=A0ABS4G4V0_9CLOT|nr:Gx transporter family protein [Youngiibacter multivorans]MBP1919502.1 heptaprenyl diphosphate synthase [Youngiibacter multivorans]
MNKTTRMVFIALIVAQALVLHVVEGMIPLPIGVPGARLGLANIFTIISLYTLGFKSSLVVVLLRVFLATFFGGNLSSMMYSLSGGLLSLIVMAAVKNLLKDKVSIIGVSGAGAISHNIGQLLVASYIVQNITVMLYLPVLTFIGIGTGIFVGITANFIMAHLRKIPSLKKIMAVTD